MIRLKQNLLVLLLLLRIPGAFGESYNSHSCENFFNNARPLREFRAKLSTNKLAFEITERRKRVPEFQFIAEQAKKHGLRVWLFGGTAASFSHYVKWDLLREYGDHRFQAEYFDYDYTHIYRSTQDLDLVINGTVGEAQKLQHILEVQFPYFSGGKTTPWEVRSLKNPTADKGGLLDDFGFMNQNTDSSSTGMIELTHPPQGESVVRDLRDWNNNQNSQFLQDVTDGVLTFYPSLLHLETPRAQAGKNPKIFSVIRALTKAFQYDLKLKSSDIELFKNEVLKFNPKTDLNHPYASEWIEQNGKKLFQNAINIEYAWNTIESIGLRKKLISIRKDEKKIDTLSWWMNKEPLRSKPIGEAQGRTAQSLDITVVAHETSDFIAYESITRSYTGTPNVFISRDDFAAETAYHGDGFYTSIGKKGAGNTGITIRFKVNPRATLGVDFVYVNQNSSFSPFIKDGDFIIWKNKNALEVIPESLDMNLLEYFQHLASGNGFKREDRALLWKFRRQLNQKIISGQIPNSESEEIRKLIASLLFQKPPAQDELISEWMRFELLRIKYTNEQIEHWIQLWKNKNYRIDPLPLFKVFTEISKDTSIEHLIANEWLLKLTEELQMDIGDRTLEDLLFCQIPVLKNFGLHTLRQRQSTQNKPFIQALQKIIDNQGNIDGWLKSKPDTTQIAAYLAVHPEKRALLSDYELSRIELKLREMTFLPTFETHWGNSLPVQIKSESFQFVSYQFPPEGKKAILGSPEYEAGRIHGKENQHDVIFTLPFQIQVTPVTQLQWALISRPGKTPSAADVM